MPTANISSVIVKPRSRALIAVFCRHFQCSSAIAAHNNDGTSRLTAVTVFAKTLNMAILTWNFSVIEQSANWPFFAGISLLGIFTPPATLVGGTIERSIAFFFV
jgi:hypothetical protein